MFCMFLYVLYRNNYFDILVTVPGVETETLILSAISAFRKPFTLFENTRSR